MPWSERKRYIWWNEQDGKWTGLGDAPDFPPTKDPGYRLDEDAEALDAIAGDKPFILHPDGRGWIFVPIGLVDGPLPAHYEPHESPFTNPPYTQQQNPTRQVCPRVENPYHPTNGEQGADVFRSCSQPTD
jgi:formate dehydrogenase major subunit